MKTVECKIRVRYNEVGRQGFVHHASYLNWFDIAQETLINMCDMSYTDIEDLGFIWATVEDQCTYLHPARYNDILTVRLSVADLSPVKIRFSYEVLREKDAVVVAVGQTSHIFVDHRFRPHSLKKVVPVLYDTIASMV